MGNIYRTRCMCERSFSYVWTSGFRKGRSLYLSLSVSILRSLSLFLFLSLSFSLFFIANISPSYSRRSCCVTIVTAWPFPRSWAAEEAKHEKKKCFPFYPSSDQLLLYYLNGMFFFLVSDTVAGTVDKGSWSRPGGLSSDSQQCSNQSCSGSL